MRRACNLVNCCYAYTRLCVRQLVASSGYVAVLPVHRLPPTAAQTHLALQQDRAQPAGSQQQTRVHKRSDIVAKLLSVGSSIQSWIEGCKTVVLDCVYACQHGATHDLHKSLEAAAAEVPDDLQYKPYYSHVHTHQWSAQQLRYCCAVTCHSQCCDRQQDVLEMVQQPTSQYP
jgi:hypothetical protein